MTPAIQNFNNRSLVERGLQYEPGNGQQFCWNRSKCQHYSPTEDTQYNYCECIIKQHETQYDNCRAVLINQDTMNA